MTARHVFVSFICLLVACLSGCFTSGPEDNASFGNINALADLDGIYQNAGDGGSDSGTLYLSKIVWPKDTTLDHKSIDQIEVRSTNATALTVTARAGGTPVKVQQFDRFLARDRSRGLRDHCDCFAVILAAHDFAQAFAAPEVILTRSERVDGTPQVPSRWLLRLRTLLSGLGLDAQLQPPTDTPWLVWAARRNKTGAVVPARRPAPCPPVPLRPRKLSVTAIETWLANPYATYAQFILQLDQLPALTDTPGADLRGSFIHQALHRFVKEHPAALPADVEARLMALLDEIMAEHAAHPRVAAFWRPRFRRFADWFAATEPGRRQGIGSIHPETKGALVLAAPAGPFRLTARADRIDRREDGGLVITDYKTGRAPDDKRVTSALAPQLPLEAAIGLAGGFEGLAAGPVAVLRYVSASGAEPPGEERQIKCDDIAALAKRMLSGLERLISAYDDPATGYRAVRRPAFKDGYRYDDYAHLARVKEWGEGGSDD